MRQSLLTFSILKDAMKKIVDADLIARIIKEAGYDEVDMMEFEFQVYGKDKLLKALKKYNVRLGSLIIFPSFYSAQDQVEDYIKGNLELAKEAEAKVIMVVPGSGDDKAVCEKMTRQEMLDLAVQHFTKACELAKPYGMKIGFENTPQDHKPLASAKDVQYILEHVPDLGLIFDTGNFRVADVNADEVAIYEQLKNRIIRFHLKDVRIGNFPQGERCVNGQYIIPVPTGSGVIPICELIRRSQNDGFDGVYAIEYAAPSDTAGAAHIEAVRSYRQMAERMEQGNWIRCPQADFPGLDKRVSRLFFGTATMPFFIGTGTQLLLDLAVANGINAIDTARGYGPAEERLGDWIEARGNREEIVLLTKCGNAAPDGSVHIDRQVIETELEQSLKALKTDYIDIYLLHRDDPKTTVSEFIDTLNEAKKAGKIKVFGASNWTHERLQEANDYAKATGQEGFTCSSPNYGLARQITDPWGGGCITISGPENAEARAWYEKNQMPVIAYSSLGRGFFSGKFKSFDYNKARTILDPTGQKGYLCEDNMRRLAEAEKIADENGLSVPQVAMQFILNSPMNVFAAVSTGSLSRILENVDAAVSPMNAEDYQRLDQINE